MSISSINILRRYQYDPLNRLISLTDLERAATQRFYQNNHVITELGEQTRRTILRNGSQLLAQQQSDAGVNDTTLLATDQGNSPLRAISQNSSRDLAYTAYGHHPAQTGLGVLPGFNGESADAMTGHYLLGQGKRAFNPALMRFNSPDELSPFGEGGINAYAYCKGDPINFSDPTGHVPLAAIFKPWDLSRKTVKGVLDLSKRISRSKRPPKSLPKKSVQQPIAYHSTPIASTSAQASHIQPSTLPGNILAPYISATPRSPEFGAPLRNQPTFREQQWEWISRFMENNRSPTSPIGNPPPEYLTGALNGGPRLPMPTTDELMEGMLVENSRNISPAPGGPTAHATIAQNAELVRQ